MIINNTTSAWYLPSSRQTVKQIQAIPGTANIPIDISKLAKGIYSVKVTSASSTTTQKLLVQ